MNAPPWATVRQELERILDLSEAERSHRLAALDDPLKQEVESLLEAHESAGAFLETPEAISALRVLAQSTFGARSGWIGRRVGSYRIVDDIGSGGMGSVYRAERDDGQFKLQVAVKII